ncbi:hypothetical protein D9M70_634650 [compost metagenome]
MQCAVVDVGGAEVAAGVTQCGTGLLAVTLELGGVQLGAQWLEKRDGLVDIAFGSDEIVDRQRHQLGGAHRSEVGGKDGQIAHGRSPHWYARVKVECRETRRSKASTSEIR